LREQVGDRNPKIVPTPVHLRFPTPGERWPDGGEGEG
jgi:hypothetical protein